MLYMRQCQRWELLHVSTTKQREQSCPSLTSTRQQTGVVRSLNTAHGTQHDAHVTIVCHQHTSTLHWKCSLDGVSKCSLNIPNCTLVVPTAVQRNCNASLILKSSTETPQLPTQERYRFKCLSDANSLRLSVQLCSQRPFKIAICTLMDFMRHVGDK